MTYLMTYMPFMLVPAFIGCGFLGISCSVPSAMPAADSVSVQTSSIATSSPDVTVTTTVDGKSTTKTLDAPYGIRSSVITDSNGSTTTAEASTTPLTEADAAKLQQQMEHMLAEQQQLFADAFNGF